MDPNDKKPSDDTIVSFQNATLRIRQRWILADTDWVVKRYQHRTYQYLRTALK